jgi:hypothetical protein
VSPQKPLGAVLPGTPAARPAIPSPGRPVTPGTEDGVSISDLDISLFADANERRDLPPGWKCLVDTATGRSYYFDQVQ